MTNSNLEKKILNILADQIGVEFDDIKLKDTFSQDLHMGAVKLTEFAKNLQENGINIEISDLAEHETIGDLIEFLSSEEEIE